MQEIFLRHEPRDLAYAVRHFLGRDYRRSSVASSHVLAIAAILDAQLERYRDLPRTVAGLHRQFARANAAQQAGFPRSCDSAPAATG